MISDVAQRMTNSADHLTNIAAGGVQANEQQDLAAIFTGILKSAGKPRDQWSDGERLRLVTGALDFVAAGNDPAEQGTALREFSGLVRNLASDDVLSGDSERPNGSCGCEGSEAPSEPVGSSDTGSCESDFEVNGNSIDTGRYCITASNDDSGTLRVTDKETGKTFKVWGDPHIETGDGDKTDFHRKPATFVLPDNTKITIDPTDGAGKTFIEKIAITRGDDAVEMTGFRGDLKTEAKPGEGQSLDQQYTDGTILKTKNGEIDDLLLPNGEEITGNKIKDIDEYAGTEPNADGDVLNGLNGVIDQLKFTPAEKDALKTVVSLLGRLVDGGNGGAESAPQPTSAPTRGAGESGAAEPAAHSGGFDQILNALTALVDKLDLPANEKDALKTVMSLIGRLIGGGEQPDLAAMSAS